MGRMILRTLKVLATFLSLPGSRASEVLRL
ncbi:hypothetical protein E2C01_058768 [Portunus trituberculatus]|uniref:Uncharacterized protein n=1 Tax=Portunus trituberculatus TaxID=210409 RepID=A0A5B7GXC4_PORTR|nr:hypothetical protein [Portunus trituberculatus]